MLEIAYPSSLNCWRLNCWPGVLAKLLNVGVRFLVCLWPAVPEWGAMQLWKLHWEHTALISFRSPGKGVKGFWKHYKCRCFKIERTIFFFSLLPHSGTSRCGNHAVLHLCLSKSSPRAIRGGGCRWTRGVSWLGKRYGRAPPGADWDSALLEPLVELLRSRPRVCICCLVHELTITAGRRTVSVLSP